VGFPNPYSAPGQEIPRNFQDTYSARLGGEGAFEAGPVTLAPRLGASYESSAVPAKYLSALTVDGNKLTLGAGIGVHYKSWRFDVTYARVFMQGTDVAVDEAGLPLLSPLETNSKDPTYVNAGLYEPSINVLGVGLAYQFGSDPSPEKKQGQSK
jgi:long-chain fatty acid transport protein